MNNEHQPIQPNPVDPTPQPGMQPQPQQSPVAGGFQPTEQPYQQQQQPAPMGMQYPSSSSPSGGSSKKKLIISLIVAGVLLLGGGVTWAIVSMGGDDSESNGSTSSSLDSSGSSSGETGSSGGGDVPSPQSSPALKNVTVGSLSGYRVTNRDVDDASYAQGIRGMMTIQKDDNSIFESVIYSWGDMKAAEAAGNKVGEVDTSQAAEGTEVDVRKLPNTSVRGSDGKTYDVTCHEIGVKTASSGGFSYVCSALVSGGDYFFSLIFMQEESKGGGIPVEIRDALANTTLNF